MVGLKTMYPREVTEQETGIVKRILRKLAQSGLAIRKDNQTRDVHVNPDPAGFYSNTPSLDDINSSYEYASSEAPYLTAVFNAGLLRETLQKLESYASEFQPITNADPNDPAKFFWKNSQFSYSDAMSYYCFIRMLRPKTIIEIGSGFSTLVAIDAVKKNESGVIVCFEPFPRPFLEENPNISLMKQRAQEIDPDWLNQSLQDGDILFIDSTHTVKTGSDCLHIYLRLLPYLKRNIYVHVHDVYLPFGMPREWLVEKGIFWTEQYLLLALITDNPKAKVLYGSAYHHTFNREALEQMMNRKYGSGGASFWFEYRGRSN
jgi:cephalosporin hydroxylase